jgi:hypothetical protein
MENQKRENFQRFANAFLNTAKEKLIQLNPDQQRNVLRGLAGMHHYYQDTDRFHQLRNGEELAVKLSRKQGGSNHDG